LRTVSESSTIIISGGPAAAAASGGGRSLRRLDDHRRFGGGVQSLRQLHRIDDQHDLAGAQHRRARNARDACQLRPDVLDQDFLVPDHLIDVHSCEILAVF
jgi:hypothetical protein